MDLFFSYTSFPRKLNRYSYKVQCRINCTSFDQSKLRNFVECTISHRTFLQGFLNNYSFMQFRIALPFKAGLALSCFEAFWLHTAMSVKVKSLLGCVTQSYSCMAIPITERHTGFCGKSNLREKVLRRILKATQSEY